MAEFIRSAIVYLRALFAALLSAALVGIFALPFAFPLGGVFRGGEGVSKKRGVYTLYSASSSGCFTDNPDFLKLFAVRGEAAVYEFSAENSASREEILNAVSKKLNAEVRFTEEAGAKKIGDSFVNLQVVFRGGETILGVPLVFGGY